MNIENLAFIAGIFFQTIALSYYFGRTKYSIERLQEDVHDIKVFAERAKEWITKSETIDKRLSNIENRLLENEREKRR